MIQWKIPDLQFIKQQVKITHCRSSGPGGQNVNKRSTQAEIRFHVLQASWVPEEVRKHLNSITAHQQNGAGEYLVASQEMRTQEGNTALCLKKIRARLEDALRLANGGMTRDEEARAKAKRNKDRIKRRRLKKELESLAAPRELPVVQPNDPVRARNVE